MLFSSLSWYKFTIEVAICVGTSSGGAGLMCKENNLQAWVKLPFSPSTFYTSLSNDYPTPSCTYPTPFYLPQPLQYLPHLSIIYPPTLITTPLYLPPPPVTTPTLLLTTPPPPLSTPHKNNFSTPLLSTQGESPQGHLRNRTLVYNF